MSKRRIEKSLIHESAARSKTNCFAMEFTHRRFEMSEEYETVNRVLELERQIAVQEFLVQRIAVKLDDLYTKPDRVWLTAWLGEEIEALDNLQLELRNI